MFVFVCLCVSARQHALETAGMHVYACVHWWAASWLVRSPDSMVQSRKHVRIGVMTWNGTGCVEPYHSTGPMMKSWQEITGCFPWMPCQGVPPPFTDSNLNWQGGGAGPSL